MLRTEMAKIAEKIVEEHAESLRKHLSEQAKVTRREIEQGIVNTNTSDFKRGFFEVVREYTEKHGIKLLPSEVEELALITAMTAMAKL